MTVSSQDDEVYCTVSSTLPLNFTTSAYSRDPQLILNDEYLAGTESASSSHARQKLYPLIQFTQQELSSSLEVYEMQNAYDHLLPTLPLANTDPMSPAETLMGRPDLAETFTKLHLWRQTQFRRILYLDADTLPLRAPDELFALPHAFAAAPELGFPDCFNSGVMLLEPCRQTYQALLRRAGCLDDDNDDDDDDHSGTNEHTPTPAPSFDGGDQGLLNAHFPAFHRLSACYNLELHHVYRIYMPAFHHFRPRLALVHFIGRVKPWHLGPRGSIAAAAAAPEDSAYARLYDDFVARWWAVYRSL
ncbi:MAG: glycogenin glucosyltransferase [Claussenomyces sp. TS43310]|nr:MAG: glycogenin glucosyltransferase [Claussenomyces sp. TS43310]